MLARDVNLKSWLTRYCEARIYEFTRHERVRVIAGGTRRNKTPVRGEASAFAGNVLPLISRIFLQHRLRILRASGLVIRLHRLRRDCAGLLTLGRGHRRILRQGESRLYQPQHVHRHKHRSCSETPRNSPVVGPQA